MDDMIGLIPAAGRGLRLGLPYPKELYPVIRENRYKPVAQFVVENLVTAGLKHIVFVINETKHQLVGYFGDGHRFGCNFSYVVQEPISRDDKDSLPGLAHALNSAYHLIRGKTVFFGMADTIMQPNDVFSCAINQANQDDDVILALFPTDQPQKFGMVKYDEQKKVLEIIDKPKQTDLMEMWGAIIWRPQFTEYLRECVAQRKMGDFAIIMNDAIQSGYSLLAARIDKGSYTDLGTYDEIMDLERRFREGWKE
jgi:glucose-1-phosphate thymidylyltransferase